MEADKEGWTAFHKAQKEFTTPVKDLVNPHFRSRYASLKSIRDACFPALHKYGLTVHQEFCSGEKYFWLRTVVGFNGAAVCSAEVPVFLGRNDMQSLGSAITYARRYGLQLVAGLMPDDDDDGNAATKPAVEVTADQDDNPFSGSFVEEPISDNTILDLLMESDKHEEFATRSQFREWAKLTTGVWLNGLKEHQGQRLLAFLREGKQWEAVHLDALETVRLNAGPE